MSEKYFKLSVVYIVFLLLNSGLHHKIVFVSLLAFPKVFKISCLSLNLLVAFSIFN